MERHHPVGARLSKAVCPEAPEDAADRLVALPLSRYFAENDCFLKPVAQSEPAIRRRAAFGSVVAPGALGGRELEVVAEQVYDRPSAPAKWESREIGASAALYSCQPGIERPAAQRSSPISSAHRLKVP